MGFMKIGISPLKMSWPVQELSPVFFMMESSVNVNGIFPPSLAIATFSCGVVETIFSVTCAIPLTVKEQVSFVDFQSVTVEGMSF